MNKFKNVFKTEKPVIGMIHFMPLLGYKEYLGIDKILKKALRDLEALERGGVDGVMVENNYDVPHKITVEPETLVCMSYLTREITQNTRLPVGVAVLWNDYKAALSIAKVCGGRFIRVPVFVDNVRTDYGDIFGNPEDVISYRRKIGADSVLIFTDIHVKHAQLLSKNTLEKSAREATRKKSDAIIVTGKWTGDVPIPENLRRVREAIGKFPILVGSGASNKNMRKLMRFADGIIVGTSLKTGRREKKNVNIKRYTENIDEEKVRRFVKEFKKIIRR